MNILITLLLVVVFSSSSWAITITRPGGGGGEATGLNCTDCVGSGEIEDGAVQSNHLDSDLYGTGTIDDTTSLATHSDLKNILPQTVDAATDTINCGDWGPAKALVTLSGGSYTLTSDPQILAGGTNHTCEIEVVAATNPTDTLTIIDGAGTNDPLGYDIPISIGKSVEWTYRSTVWEHTYRSIWDKCTLFDASGNMDVDCGASLGILAPLFNPTDTTATVTVSSCKGEWYANGDDDAIEYDLLAVDVGMNCCFETPNYAQTITLDPNGTEQISLNGTLASAGEAIVSSGSVADFACIKSDPTGTFWTTRGIGGTWNEATP